MFGLLLPILAQLPGLLGNFFKQKNEIESARLETQRQVELAKQQMAAETAKAQLELNKTIVSSTGAYFKYFTFVMWFGPFMIGIAFPTYAKDIFTNLGTMPEWYVQSCMLIMFTVWGISVSAPVVGGIFTGLSQFFADKRQYKLDKLTIINRKAFYDELRKQQGYVSEDDVKRNEKLFDALEKDAMGHGK